MPLTEPAWRKIRDKAFARRLISAIEMHPHAPAGHGRQKWLREQLESRYGVKFSAEAIRKWFAGEARPKPDTMRKVAQVLEVNEAWLSLDIQPDEVPIEKQKRNANADGAVNLVAGLIQMGGGTIAFPESTEKGFDIFVIIGGKQHKIIVKRVRLNNEAAAVVNVPVDIDGLAIVAVVDTKKATEFEFLRLPEQVVKAHARGRGGFIEVPLNSKAGTFLVGDAVIPRIENFQKIEGVLPRSAKAEKKVAQL